MSFIKRKRRFKKKGRIVIFVIILMISAAFCSLKIIDDRIFPGAVAIAGDHAKNMINRYLNRAVKNITENQNISSSDFYVKTEDAAGEINSLSVNTMLINSVCADLSDDITSSIAEAGIGEIKIPLGSLLGIKSLANIGPDYPITVMPSGESEVDYESGFRAEGINQINFEIWLNVTATLRIVNPLQEDSIVVTRRIPLVNTLIPGKVPDTFLDWNK